MRTPLNGVLGYIQIAKTEKNLTADQHESLDNIQQCGQHLLMLINDVLDLSKIEASKMELSPARVNIFQLSLKVLLISSRCDEQKGIAFNYEQLSALA